MFNPQSLMPTMPAPGSAPLAVTHSGQPSTIHIPRVAGRRSYLHPISTLTDPLEPMSKRITDQESLQQWIQSEAYLRIMCFIQCLNESVANKKISDSCHISKNVFKVIQILDTLDSWIDEIPPEVTPQRFGNIAFRSWAKRLHAEAESLHDQILPSNLTFVKVEIATYLANGFGDGTRIDYGSGHELAFVAWLCSLELLDLFDSKDYQALVLRVFTRYLEIVRRLQRVYMLEPAGSHGVWGLDDHQFLPYFWGSSQLLDHSRIKPKSIVQKDIVTHFSKEYLYLACIDYIHQVKTGPFHEHSPILYDISGVMLWSKVNSGMLKMYMAEVLHKFPVVQHFYFGKLLPFEPAYKIQPQDKE
ncbi:Serine/threonine-protein phosphatase 2A activator 1 [Batrachochytrium dendrobatidis]|nr:Serine/threonine-protein phosphatase 2A activator 1 [Batrachochytrium dendrobatidis]KAK5670303.1 Serine/threonine-protein phosphatase 2A activator 1 [Batrachochytrium dendrobatidis]